MYDVYCKDCKFFTYDEVCMKHATLKKDFKGSSYYCYSDIASRINRCNDCKEYKRKWWKFWVLQ